MTIYKYLHLLVGVQCKNIIVQQIMKLFIFTVNVVNFSTEMEAFM